MKFTKSTMLAIRPYSLSQASAGANTAGGKRETHCRRFSRHSSEGRANPLRRSRDAPRKVGTCEGIRWDFSACPTGGVLVNSSA